MTDFLGEIEKDIKNFLHKPESASAPAVTTPVIVVPTLQPHSTPPHDDTEAMITFYGKPWEDSSLLVQIPVPFPMTFREDNGHLIPIPHLTFHKKAASALINVFNKIAVLYKTDPTVIKHVTHFSGSYNYRPIRGSTRLSDHAFGAAIDFDAENQPMTYEVCHSADQPQAVYDAFKSEGFWWGGDFHSRKDPMHWQFAYEK